MADCETVDVRVKGRVQGVGFRATALRHAHLYGVKGWVSNAADGSIELLLQGDADAIDRMVSWLYIGPEQAVVEHVDIQRSYTDKRYGFFEIR
ncbi:MAG: acylphosphatase [Alcaligenes sp.]